MNIKQGDWVKLANGWIVGPVLVTKSGRVARVGGVGVYYFAWDCDGTHRDAYQELKIVAVLDGPP